jgi:hypothetical protein
MPALTAQQAQSLALSVRDYAHTSSDFLHNQWDSLTPDDRQQVHDTIFDLLLRADDLNALAGILTLDNAQSSVDQINAAVVSADQFLQKVADVKKGIGVITAGLGLATAVASKNPADILSGVKALRGALA